MFLFHSRKRMIHIFYYLNNHMYIKRTITNKNRKKLKINKKRQTDVLLCDINRVCRQFNAH